MRFWSVEIPNLISEGREDLVPTLRGPGEKRATDDLIVLSLADQTSPHTLAMVFVRTYHTRCEQDEAIRRRDEIPKSKKARSICAGLLFEGRLPFYPKGGKCSDAQTPPHKSESCLRPTLGGEGCVSRHSNRHAPRDIPEAQGAFKVLMIHWILQFARRIAFRCVLHRCGSQDIRR